MFLLLLLALMAGWDHHVQKQYVSEYQFQGENSGGGLVPSETCLWSFPGATGWPLSNTEYWTRLTFLFIPLPYVHFPFISSRHDLQIPYLGFCCCEEIGETGLWQLTDPPILPLTHGPTGGFNWRETLLQE